MAGGHAHALYRHGHTALHELAPEVKVAATFGFVVAVVATPREAFGAFAVHAALLVTALVVARVPPGFVLPRLMVVAPFLVAVATLPVLGPPPDNAWGLSVAGLWGAWNIFAKAMLGMLATIALAATTEPSDLVTGLERLRMPRVVTAIMGFMIRYLDVVVGQVSRMSVAMRSRGYRPRWLGAVGPFARSLGSLFVRSFERGERVYLAMVARGYEGRMPASVRPGSGAAPGRVTPVVLGVAIAWVAAMAALVLR